MNTSLTPLSAIANPRESLFFRLSGGLGNLMFQYAAGEMLARKHQCPLYFVPDVPMIHGSALELLGITVNHVEVPPALVARAARKKDKGLVEVLRSATGGWPLTPVREPHFHYWPEFFDIRPGSLIFGYWQSSKYFKGLEGELAARIAPEKLLDAEMAALARDYAGAETVAVHVRRNDYATNPEVVRIHGLMERDYYDRARAAVSAGRTIARYLVFSDDPVAAQALLAGWENTEFLPARAQQVDLALMAQCRHQIIANSTFSWWAALLNRNPDKQVIAPRYWFSRETLLSRYVLDLLPDDWVLL